MVGECGQSLTADEESLTKMREYLEERHVKNINWHFTLNNHASTRPHVHGGKLVESVTKCKTFEQVAPNKFRCRLTLPNSFKPGDGIVLETCGEGRSEKEADESACEAAFALLLLHSPDKVVLRPKHWTVSPQELVDGLPRRSRDAHQALPVHEREKSEHAGALGAAMVPEELDGAVQKILDDILRSHGGTMNPARINHQLLVEHHLADPGEKKMWQRLDELLPPDGLRLWIDMHPAFEYKELDQGGMVVTWAPGHAPAFGSAVPEEQHEQETQGIDLR